MSQEDYQRLVDEFGDPDTYWEEPAPEHLVAFLMRMDPPLGSMGGIIPTELLRRSASIGITLNRGQASALIAALRKFQASPHMQFRADEVQRETKIADLARALMMELRPDLNNGDAHPIKGVWGQQVDPDDWEQEPEDYVDLQELFEMLEVVEKSAAERATWLATAKSSSLKPGNRADSMRTFYWLILLRFWTSVLGRDIAVSSNAEGKASGPLIRFICVMTEGLDFEDRRTANAIKEWVRRNRNKVDRVAEFFED